MLSSTYQMSSNYDEKAAEVDPENTLLWRANRQRLEAEEIRDAVTAVTGDHRSDRGRNAADLQGPRTMSANTSKRGGNDYDNPRRAVYLPVVRSSMYEMFQAFDLPDPSTPNGDRNSTVIAPQALFMMNATLVLKSTRIDGEKAAGSAAISTTPPASAKRRNERCARPPAASEMDRALTFIAQVEKAMEDKRKGSGGHGACLPGKVSARRCWRRTNSFT